MVKRSVKDRESVGLNRYSRNDLLHALNRTNAYEPRASGVCAFHRNPGVASSIDSNGEKKKQ